VYKYKSIAILHICPFYNKLYFWQVQNKYLQYMKQFTLAIVCSLMCIAYSAKAQIFINTGNENLEKYKQENPDIKIYDENKDNVPPKAAAKVKEEVETVPAKVTPAKPATPAKAPKVAKAPAAPAAAPATTPAAAASAPAKQPSMPAYDGPLTPAENDLPANVEPGKCYARCFIPDQFEFKEEQVVDRPAFFRTKTIPARYRTEFDTIITRAASVKKVDVPAQYETLTEDVMVSPATTRWQKGKADASCLSANPADCQVMCLVEVPAVYKKVSRRVVKTPAYVNEIEIPADFKIISRQVIEEPAKTEKSEVPAVYKTVMRKVLSKKGGYQEWREVLCADKLDTQRILAIQKALKAEGYDPGPFDNMFGTQTKQALIKFQQDKGLPVGNLNLETLKSLGVQ
jgi:hypothetical protein